jgi:2-C-methyl-D-erythritol 2,4-cyclodiphosphate synthase
MNRVGLGFDVHRFRNISVENNTIMLGGIAIPCKYAIEAHSDGDVVLHALTDAILGSLALGDIGEHFPPSDSKWKDADSSIFLTHANKLIKEKNAYISNVDIVVMAEKPKVSPYKLEIRKRIAELLELSVEQVSVKATTTEKLGFTGREEGIAAHAICSVFIK